MNNIINLFDPSRGNIPIELSRFHGGEPHVKILLQKIPDIPGSPLTIHAPVKDAYSFFQAVATVDASYRAGYRNITLRIPYLPGGRQDRVCNPGESLTVKLYCNILNGLPLDRIIIDTPHSDVSSALISNVEVRENLTQLAIKAAYSTGAPIVGICAPDAGANKRVLKIAQEINRQGEQKAIFIRCDKTRDLRTNAITDFVVHHDSLANIPCIVCDDIISGGGTFRGLEAELTKKQAPEVHLAVFHVDFLEGLNETAKSFKSVWVTNSRGVDLSGSHDNVVVTDIY